MREGGEIPPTQAKRSVAAPEADAAREVESEANNQLRCEGLGRSPNSRRETTPRGERAGGE